MSTEVLAIQRDDVAARGETSTLAVLLAAVDPWGGEWQRHRYSAGGAVDPVSDYSINDRTESAARAGLRYRFPRRWTSRPG